MYSYIGQVSNRVDHLHNVHNISHSDWIEGECAAFLLTDAVIVITICCHEF